jgi:biotin carboxylase
LRVLVLGTGDAQADAIAYFKTRGDHVSAASYRREGPGVAAADEFVHIDIVDREGVLACCAEKGVGLVFSTGSDIAMPTIGYVSGRLGLPCYVPEDTAALMQNKVRFRAFLHEFGIDDMPFIAARAAEDLEAWKLYPAVMKPADCQGQRGVVTVSTPAEAAECFSLACGCSPSGEVIVEPYLDGPEVSVNGFLADGGLALKYISLRKSLADVRTTGIIHSHVMPAGLPEPLDDEIYALVIKAVKALGIENGPVYFQIKCTGSGPRIIEATPRLDGCHLWKLIQYKYGVNLLSLSVEYLFDRDALRSCRDQSAVREGAMELRFFHQAPGSAFEQRRHAAPGGSLHTAYYYGEGDEVRSINRIMEKVGYCIYPV